MRVYYEYRGMQYSIAITPTETVEQLKQKIADNEQTTVISFEIFFNNKPLKSNQTMAKLGVQDGDVFEYSLRIGSR